MNSLFSIFETDALDMMRHMPDESIDLAITDPAYESLEKHRKIGTTTRLSMSKSSSNKWFEIFPNKLYPELFSQLYRVMRRNTHTYIMCDQETMFVIKPIAEDAGFKFWKPIVWDKMTMGMGYHYRARYEFILFFEKGKRKLLDLSVPDVLPIKRVRDGYPTEKPVELSEILIRQSSVPGDIVFDPFCGSGSVGVAAIKSQRSFIGCDLSFDAANLSTARLLSIGGTQEFKMIPRMIQDRHLPAHQLGLGLAIE